MALYECNIPCEYKNPLGYCMLTYCAKKEVELPNGSWDKDYKPTDATKEQDKYMGKMRNALLSSWAGRDTELQQASKALGDAVDGVVDAIERLKSVLLDLKKIKENKND